MNAETFQDILLVVILFSVAAIMYARHFLN